MSHKKFGPNRFSRFDVYWTQTNRSTDRQTDKPNLYIEKASKKNPVQSSLKVYLGNKKISANSSVTAVTGVFRNLSTRVGGGRCKAPSLITHRLRWLNPRSWKNMNRISKNKQCYKIIYLSVVSCFRLCIPFRTSSWSSPTGRSGRIISANTRKLESSRTLVGLSEYRII